MMEGMMNLLPIQVTQDGVLIPRQYFPQGTAEYELELINGYVLVKPKLTPVEPLTDVYERFPWIGIAETNDPTASARVDEILAAEFGLESA
jgi:hypothetical protein